MERRCNGQHLSDPKVNLFVAHLNSCSYHSHSEYSSAVPDLALFTPEDLRRAEEAGELDIDANIFNLRPDPGQFVSFLQSLERVELVSDVFAKLLDAYRETKAARDSDPMKYVADVNILRNVVANTTQSITLSANHYEAPIPVGSKRKFVEHPETARPGPGVH